MHVFDEGRGPRCVVCDHPKGGKGVGGGNASGEADQVFAADLRGDATAGEQVADDVGVCEASGSVDADLVGTAWEVHARKERTGGFPVKGRGGIRP